MHIHKIKYYQDLKGNETMIYTLTWTKPRKHCMKETRPKGPRVLLPHLYE